MYTSNNNWPTTIKSQQQQTLMHSFISTVTTSGLEDMNNLAQSLSQMDKTLSKVYARQHYDPQLVQNQILSHQLQSPTKLFLPKSNTLTDALIRNTLGCDQKYAKQYMQLLGQTQQDVEKQKRIDEIKKQFTQSNKFVDISANSKPFLPKKRNQLQRPVVDNQHEGYLKTQLIFLQKPNNNKIAHKQYYEKHYDTITQQIEQLGGMEDTLSKMENTLKNHQLTNVKNKSILKEVPSSPKHNPFSLLNSLQSKSFAKTSSLSQMNTSSNWLEKSKHMREHFLNKFTK